MHGVAAIINIMTGLVVNNEELSIYCHSCSLKKAQLGADTAVFAEWYATYRDDCSVNYHGSSNAVEAAKRLRSHSVHTRGLMYTGMLGDGDSKAYQAVVDLERRVREPCPQAHGNGSSQAGEAGGAGEACWTWQKALKLQ